MIRVLPTALCVAAALLALEALGAVAPTTRRDLSAKAVRASAAPSTPPAARVAPVRGVERPQAAASPPPAPSQPAPTDGGFPSFAGDGETVVELVVDSAIDRETLRRWRRTSGASLVNAELARADESVDLRRVWLPAMGGRPSEFPATQRELDEFLTATPPSSRPWVLLTPTLAAQFGLSAQSSFLVVGEGLARRVAALGKGRVTIRLEARSGGRVEEIVSRTLGEEEPS